MFVVYDEVSVAELGFADSALERADQLELQAIGFPRDVGMERAVRCGAVCTQPDAVGVTARNRQESPSRGQR
jgi:hypothetical protein